MAQIRIPLLLCIALLISASARAAGVPELRVSPFTVSGVYSVTFNLNLASQLPAGTTITCRARIAPNLGGLDTGSQQLARIPVKTVAGMARLTGSTATCAAEIPIFWTLLSERGGAVLSYEIDAVSSFGSVPMLVRSSGLQNVAVAFPASGGRTNLSLNLAF
jgi:hypothetical protein